MTFINNNKEDHRAWIAKGGRNKDLPMLNRLLELERRNLPTPKAWYEARTEAYVMYKQLKYRWKPSFSQQLLLGLLDKLLESPKYKHDVIHVLDLHNLRDPIHDDGVVTEAEVDAWHAALQQWRKKMLYTATYSDRERPVPFVEYGGPPGTAPEARRRLLAMLKKAVPLTKQLRGWLREHNLPISLLLPKQI